MSFVTFVRDYIQDPDRIVHIPNFIFDACKDFVWYIFSFQWFRNLIYVTLSFPSLKQSSTANTNISSAFLNEISTLSDSIGQQNHNSIQNTNVASTSSLSTFGLAPQDAVNTLSQNTNISSISSYLAEQGSIDQTYFPDFLNNLLHNNSGSTWLSTNFELPPLEISIFHNGLYGFFNGITSTFHFCAVTILIIHVLLNENKSRAFKIALASCFGDVSYMIAVLLGFTGLVIPWLSLEPLGYILGFFIQFFFALEIIKDNRRVKANFDRQFRAPSTQKRSAPTIKPQAEKTSSSADYASPKERVEARNMISERGQSGVLSFNRWLIPLLVLFSWCEQTQFFQTGSVFSLQPTSTLLEIPGFTKEFQVLIYLSTFIITRILVTWICLSIFENLINGFSESKTTSYNLKGLFLNPIIGGLSQFYNLFVTLLTDRQAGFSSIKRKSSDFKIIIQDTYNSLRPIAIKSRVINLFYSFKSWFVPKSLQVNSISPSVLEQTVESKDMYTGLSSSASAARPTRYYSSGKKIQHFLRDPLAIAAVTCSLAFLPAYSTNLLVTKSVGFFPEENRIKHSLFSPWDMPATVLASDMDFISNHPNLAEYPFFLPFYDKGEYGGWLGVGEEDIRYGPFRLWQSRRIRAPWRRTTLQEPALTFANDKSLFINPLLRTPDLKNTFTTTSNKTTNFVRFVPTDDQVKVEPSKRLNLMKGRNFARLGSQRKSETANIKSGLTLAPKAAFPDTKLRIDPVEVDANYVNRLGSLNPFSTQKWEHVWKQLKTQSAYTKLLAINSSKNIKSPLSSVGTLSYLGSARNNNRAELPPDNNFKIRTLPLFPLKDQTSSTEASIKRENLKITKTGRKKIIEMLKKPLRKVKTSSFLGLKSFLGDNSPVSSSVPTTDLSSTPTMFPKNIGLINQELQIKNNKQIRKRFKKFKKKFRVFRTRAYKKRNTKIKRLKHFHYLRNKNKKRRKSRRLIYKLRREYPYMRNIKERKADNFGLYSPVNLSKQNFLASTDMKNQSDFNDAPRPSRIVEAKSSKFDYPSNDLVPKAQTMLPSIDPTVGTNLLRFVPTEGKYTHLKEKPSYSTEYPNKKNFVNVKKDFNLIFRTQIGERLDFAQEEIRARIFMNPYVRFLLNSRIDNFVSRGTNKSSKTKSNRMAFPKDQLDSKDQKDQVGQVDQVDQRVANLLAPFSNIFQRAPLEQRSTTTSFDSVPKLRGTRPTFGQLEAQSSNLELVEKHVEQPFSGGKQEALKENDLFKRRLIISKYADAVDFLKPSPRRSYADRVYNHQFKGTLSTARRLFSLKVQYDRPLVHDLNYKSAIEHEGLLSKGPINDDERVTSRFSGNTGTLSSALPATSGLVMFDGEKTKSKPNLLEKGYSAPLYAAWDPQLRKLILTNRYLNHKTVTTLASFKHQKDFDVTSENKGQSVNQVDHLEQTLNKKHNELPETKDLSLQAVDELSIMEPKVKQGSKFQTQGKYNSNSIAGSNRVKSVYSKDQTGPPGPRKNLIQFTNWPLKESYFKDNEFLVSQLYSNSQPIDSFLSQENEKARPVVLPRRVNSFNTILNYKNNVRPTDAQRSQQFLKIESNDKKTFLFKHLWNSSNTATGFHSIGAKDNSVLSDSLAKQSQIESLTNKSTNIGRSTARSAGTDASAQYSFAPSTIIPTSAEQRKANRMEEREYPLWMVLRALPPNQGGFLWPGD